MEIGVPQISVCGVYPPMEIGVFVSLAVCNKGRAIESKRGKKEPICLKRIVLHNPTTQSYCVTVWDGRVLKLVSWNNAGDDYGNDEWSLK